ncbi:MAG: permease-like cell division protein FtsX, partial [Firmicutes bacterium]|nr:permease-like cell division protein FtsX [Candidatus Colimorpha enterica]
MKRYKPSFFIKQAFKGMFRNGMMTVASVIVLLACLTVLGSFTMLVFNIDFNLSSLESLNELVAFADTTTGYTENSSVKLPEKMMSSDGRLLLGWSLRRGTTEPEFAPGQIYKLSPDDAVGDNVTFYAVWDGEYKPEDIRIVYYSCGVKVNEAVGLDETVYHDGDKINLMGNLTARGSSVEFLGWSSIPNAADREFTGGESYKVLAERAKDGVISLYAVWSEKPVFARYSITYEAGNIAEQEMPNDAEMRLQSVKNAVNALLDGENIESIRFVSKEETLESEMEQLKDYEGLEQFFSGSDNPYPDTFIITYGDGADIKSIENRLMTISDIYKIRCNSDIAENISGLKNGISVIFFWFSVILFAVSVLVIVNTVKLAVEYRSKEIVIMRYIGATKSFIALPFELEGAIIGLFAGTVSFILQWIAYGYVSKLIMTRLQMVSVMS